MTAAVNSHASAVVLEDRGILILGGSGGGKTTLALSILLHARAEGRFARLVADDQVFLEKRGGRLVAKAPPAIAGLAEAYGVGPKSVEEEPRAVIDLVVTMVRSDAAPRYDADGRQTLLGVELPRVEASERNSQAALVAILARLSMPPFRGNRRG